MDDNLSHIDAKGNPTMVDVADKTITRREAWAQSEVIVNEKILAALHNGDIQTKKGPVFHTAIIAGVMGAKKTAELIPFCHPLALEDCQVNIETLADCIVIQSTATTTGKTGVEMEALTAATIAALTIYDMCKALSHDMVITETKLISKIGGKSDYQR